MSVLPVVRLSGAPCWWGDNRRSPAKGGPCSPQMLSPPAAGQPTAPSGHTELAGTKPQTRCGAPYRSDH